MSDRLLPAVVDALRARGALAGPRLDRVTVGDAAVFVELVDGGADGARPAGLAHRPSGGEPPVGDTVAALLDPIRDGTGGDTAEGRGARAVAVATLNALSAPHVRWRTGDPMALLAGSVDVVVTVGLFRPAFRKFADVEVRVVERGAVGDVSAPASVDVRTFRPAGTAAAMADADVVFVTGSTLVYGGTERYLAAAPDDAAVVLVGATASCLPEPLFDAGVDVVAGASVDDPAGVRAAVAGGACGTDLHDSGVRKVYAARERPSTIELRETT
ncbi:Rossmann-like domain-containing protein [Halostella litorea]|uniref:Rossmann-like domain-containing protein n=1 Tax=Halostella litorea TaxID=2528831 RepID=UPI0010927FE1|nr:DUF364 domain-containing protein [Halostella litorea]